LVSQLPSEDSAVFLNVRAERKSKQKEFRSGNGGTKPLGESL